MAAPKLGRPSRYDPAYGAQLTAHMASGLSFESFAGKIGVCIDTLYEWAKRHRAFSEAKGKGTAASILWWEHVGMMATLGGEIRLGGKVYDGKKVSPAMWIYTMKCRFRAHGWNEDAAEAQDPTSKRREFQLNYQRKEKAK